jgi:glutaredoxin
VTLKIFTLPHCPKCDELKDLLKKNGLKFEEKSLENPEIRVDALMLSIFEVPALVRGENVLYFNEIFNPKLDKKRVLQFCKS